MKNLFLLLIVFCLAGLGSCSKDATVAEEDIQISFSADTLFFDTVFTTTGSVTQSFKIFNPADHRVSVNTIRLAGGQSSPFKININGASASEITNEVIDAHDSIYVFVQVLIDPDNRQLPFIVEDSIEVQLNQQSRWMQLRAFGQNAIFLLDRKIERDTIWNDSLPVVIKGNLLVKEGVQLTIEQGANVYLNAAATFTVNGTLKSLGTVENPVVFTGDRLDPDYRGLPASWAGIFFSPSSSKNVITSTVIKNAYSGLVVQGMTTTGEPKVTLSRSIIQNIYDAGIMAVNSSISIDNSLIANCGVNAALMAGGKYSFTNCTIASYGNSYIAHDNPVLMVSTDFDNDGGTLTADMSAQFINCILWGDNGNVKDEIVLKKSAPAGFDVIFDHCIYKAENELAEALFQSGFKNEPPLFDSINPTGNIYDFHFEKHPESPAIKNGITTTFPFDLDGKQRVAPPDIGCYER